MEERQINYTIMEGYKLPSGGLIYDVPVNATVELRSMTARDEMKRLNPSTTQFKTLADIIEGCLLEKPAVRVYDMALGDYEFLLHRLRVVTYGDDYKIGVRCPFCGEEFETIAHLDELKVKEFDIEKFNSLRTFILPVSGSSITLNFQTPRMLDEQNALAKSLRRKAGDAEIDFDTLALLRTVINSVDGVKLDTSKLDAFINKLPARDMAKILNNLDALNKCVGLENIWKIDCKNCETEFETFFRFGPEFFRPTTI